MKKHWEAHPGQLQKAIRLADDAGGLIIEHGAGANGFPPATQRVGRFDNIQLDLSNDQLPWAQDEVGFLYTRHTLEDIDNPLHCLREIQRVARAGWIETPSPIAELCRGVDSEGGDGSVSPYRGYGHHRSFFWAKGNTLHCAPKYAAPLEYAEIPDDWLAEQLTEPLNWNTYHHWNGPLEFQYHQHEVDFMIGPEYIDMLRNACMGE